MNNKNQLDRGSEDYSHLFKNYLLRGAKGMTDSELRALSETSGGTVLFPTIYSNKFMEALGDDQILGQVQKMVINSSTFSIPILTPVALQGGFSLQKNPGEAGTIIDATAGSQTTVTVPTIALPGTTTSGTATSTLALKRISVMVKVSNELLEDSVGQGDASVESFIVRQAAADISTQIVKQILVGNATGTVTAGTASTVGSDSCHGIYSTCRRYSRQYPTSDWGGGISSTAVRDSIQSILFGNTNAQTFPTQYFNRATLILNSQLGRTTATTGVQGTQIVSAANAQAAFAYGSERKIFGVPWCLQDMSISNTGNAVIASGQEPMAILADLTRYLFVSSSEGATVTKLGETFAENDQTALIVSMRCAGVLADVKAALAYGLS